MLTLLSPAKNMDTSQKSQILGTTIAQSTFDRYLEFKSLKNGKRGNGTLHSKK